MSPLDGILSRSAHTASLGIKWNQEKAFAQRQKLVKRTSGTSTINSDCEIRQTEYEDSPDVPDGEAEQRRVDEAARRYLSSRVATNQTVIKGTLRDDLLRNSLDMFVITQQSAKVRRATNPPLPQQKDVRDTAGVFEDADENDKNNEDEDDEDGEDDEDDEDDVEPAKGEDNDQYVDEDDDENTKADEDENTSSSDLDNPMLEGGKRLLNHRYERDQDRRKSREQSRKSKKESFHEENGVVGPLHKLAELAEQAPMLILSSGQEFQTRGLLELRVAEFCERVGKEYKTHCSARCGLAGDAKVRFRKDSERSSEPVVPLMCHKFRRE
ncbi:hypothetical protein CYMTET_27851 [Cymbomonas tetramitiformis]|uniref:Uncharacterized protein n=1 Tax=Cymbomonas tetramitiformis TaxID=36881 RepID=A0AAE0FPH5_9CHLO|nr:hypothetical protein CYMTET_27851 [Cymbomonas tetramitiformis]